MPEDPRTTTPPARRTPRLTPRRTPGSGPGASAAGALVLWAALAACVGGPPEAPEPSDDQQYELYSTTATFLYEDDELLRAQEQAVKALDVRPDDRPMRRMIGWIRLRLGSPADVIVAEQMFRELCDEGDENGASVLGLATALERLGVGFDRASRDFASGERATEAGTSPERRAAELAERARDHWQESLELYGRTIQDGEGSTSAMNGMQRVEALLGNYDASLEWSRLLLERSQGELDAWRNMLQAEDLTEEEERLFRDSVRAAVKLQLETHLFAAAVLYDLGRFSDAALHLDAAIEVSPDEARHYARRAQVRNRIGDYAGAIEDIDRFLRLSTDPFEHPDVRRAFDLRGRWEEALARG